VVEIEIHPVSLGFGQPDYEMGFPTLARGGEAQEILEDIAARSRPYGTAMTIEDGVGRVVLGDRAA
jgi:poly-gamma-glutamate synthesis protein (capsule biosynthesis protein)